MKIRISKQSLRLRLGPKDLVTLTTKSELQEVLHTGPDLHLAFCLQVVEDAPSNPLTQSGPRLDVTVSRSAWTRWAEGPDIEWTWQLQNPELLLMIEKDLKPSRS